MAIAYIRLNWASEEAFLHGNTEGSTYEIEVYSYNSRCQDYMLREGFIITKNDAEWLETFCSGESDWRDCEDEHTSTLSLDNESLSEEETHPTASKILLSLRDAEFWDS